MRSDESTTVIRGRQRVETATEVLPHHRMSRARLFAGIEQAEMAQILGRSRNTVSAWERGVNEPSIMDVARWAQVTGRSIDWIVWGETGTAPAEAGAEPGLSQHSVRPKRLELPTFCMGVKAWTVDDDVALMLYAASTPVNGLTVLENRSQP